MHKFDLLDRVVVAALPGQPTPTAGQVWGRAFEGQPRSHVLPPQGSVLKDLPESHLRLEPVLAP